MKNKAKKTFSRRSMLKACSTALLAVIVAPSLRGATEAYAAMQNDKKILIIYYSRSGNTKFMAALINVFTGGDMFELKTVTPYPEEYRANAKQAKQELESAFLPPLQTPALITL